MKKSEREKIIAWANDLSDEELEKKYHDLLYFFVSLGAQIDKMYELGYDMSDISEREEYEKILSQKCDLLEELCEKRGIELWN